MAMYMYTQYSKISVYPMHNTKNTIHVQPKVHRAINRQKVNEFKSYYTAVQCKSMYNTNNAEDCIPIHNSVNTFTHV